MGTRGSNRWLALPGIFLVAVLGLALIKLSGGAPAKPISVDAGLSVPETLGSPGAGSSSDAMTDAGSADPSAAVASQSASPARSSEAAGIVAQPAIQHSASSGGLSSNAGEERPSDEIPLAPMGERPSRSALEGVPGYVPPQDPEANSVLTGRREAPEVDREFTGGASSADELAQQILEALHTKDRQALNSLRITTDEFGEILWPEFPASRPITQLKAADAWFFLDADCVKGANTAIDEFGGTTLLFDRIVYKVGKAPYRNFTLYEGVRILAHTADGSPVELSFAQTFAERNGVWKVYSFKD